MLPSRRKPLVGKCISHTLAGAGGARPERSSLLLTVGRGYQSSSFPLPVSRAGKPRGARLARGVPPHPSATFQVSSRTSGAPLSPSVQWITPFARSGQPSFVGLHPLFSILLGLKRLGVSVLATVTEPY